MAALPALRSLLQSDPSSSRRTFARPRCLFALLMLAVISLSTGCDNTQTLEPSVETTSVDQTKSAPRPEQTVVVSPSENLGVVSTPMVAARLAERADDLDPLSDGWETEALSEAAERQLALLAGLLKNPGRLDVAALAELLTDDFSCGDLRPSEVQTVFDDKPLLVERGVIDTAAVAERSAGDHQGIEGLSAALAALVEPLRAATDVHTKFKLYNVEVSDESFTTRQYFAISGRTATGMVEQNTTWLIRWVRPSPTAPPKIAWIGVEEFEQVRSQTPGGPLFADVTEAVLSANPVYRGQLSYGTDHWLERTQRSLIRVTGHHGLAVGDVDGDGLDDVYICQPGGQPNLPLVQQPDGTVRDMSADAGVDILDFSHTALLIDLDNDGDQDLAVATETQLLILSNDGQGRFALRSQVTAVREAYSLTAVDYDSDGDLDIYSGLYYASPSDRSVLVQTPTSSGASNGGANVLLRNDIAAADDGAWTFSDVTAEVGLDDNNRRWSFAAAWEDYDNDGDPDLYVANDASQNNLYRNDGGHFSDVARAAGVGDRAFGMSVSWGDYNRDGLMDLYVGNMFSAAGNRITFQEQFRDDISSQEKSDIQYTARGNTFFENLGDGKFRDASVESGVAMGRWSWSSLFADINNDGWEDILVANGYLTREGTDDL